MSSFTWLDYSDAERKRVLEVIDQFREDDTRDELGLGTIRDAFADLLFPGTSTIQTRARYFLFIPWVYSKLERQRCSSRDAPGRSRNLQGALRNGLLEGGEELGVIGYRAGLDVQRLPSSVYWYGLRRWGLLLLDGSEDDYQRHLDGYFRQQNSTPPADAGESPDAAFHNWDPHLPPPPDQFPKEVTFELTQDEAEYLIGRVCSKAPRSLLATLLSKRMLIGPEDFAWELPPPASTRNSLVSSITHEISPKSCTAPRCFTT